MLPKSIAEIFILVMEEATGQFFDKEDFDLEDGLPVDQDPGKLARDFLDLRDTKFRAGEGNWSVLLGTEVARAFAEANQDSLDYRLKRVQAIVMAWRDAIGHRTEVASD
jgi:hypothetical protein